MEENEKELEKKIEEALKGIFEEGADPEKQIEEIASELEKEGN